MNRHIAMKRLDAAFLRAHRTEALHEQRGYCRYCFAPMTVRSATTEHRHPRSKGGTNSKSNIGASCVQCNLAKGAMSELAFKHAIRNPEGHGLRIQLAAFRLRMWSAVHRSCKRIAASVGNKYDMPRRR